MPQISLTTFVDYVAATGTTRLSKVKAAKKQYDQPYGPERDFYGPLRKRIVQVFEEGWDPKELDALLAEVDDPKKLEPYAACRKGLRRWAGVNGKKTYRWTAPRKAMWRGGGLDVNVSPELWLVIDGTTYAIKLFFKTDKLSQHKANLSLRMMEKSVGKHGVVGILDLQQGKLFVQTTAPPEGIDQLLESEALAFASLWDALA